MAKKNKTYIAYILDRSGSMGTVKKDTIGGFNQFLDEQKAADGTCDMTMVQFDHEYEVTHRNVRIQDVSSLNDETYKPRGMTALLDAIGNTIYDTSDYIRGLAEDEKPEKVVFVIQTDGYENKSVGFDGATIKSLIDQKEELDKWDFIYLGANQDAVATAAKFGIKGGKSMTYSGTGAGTQEAFSTVSAGLSSYRSSADLSKRGTNFEFFSPEDRDRNKS